MKHIYKLITNTTQETETLLDALSKVESREEALAFLDLFEDMNLIVEEDKHLDFKDAWRVILTDSESIEQTTTYMKELFSSLLGEEE
jgi:hypothetical protein